MISVVVPAFNEEGVIEKCCMKILSVFSQSKYNCEIIVVDDGSTDATTEVVRKLINNHKEIKLLSFSRNFGHQMAVSAGMAESSGDAVVVIDADLQDPPEVIIKMIEKWEQGYEIVNARRIRREKESAFKKITAKLYYRMLKKISNVPMTVDTGDFRLIDRKVCDIICLMPEKERYIRGLVCYAGYSSCDIGYVRQPRIFGKTKYSLKKMLRLAIDGITAFSDFPLKMPFYLGLFVIFTTIIYGIYKAVCGSFMSVLLPLVSIMVSAVVLVCLGITGEYVSRIYNECKNRPMYIIKSREGFDNRENKG